jgi:hypothetical protein
VPGRGRPHGHPTHGVDYDGSLPSVDTIVLITKDLEAHRSETQTERNGCLIMTNGETVVNKTAPSVGQQIEEERLKQQDLAENSVSQTAVSHRAAQTGVIELPKSQTPPPETFKELAKATGLVDEVLGNPGVLGQVGPRLDTAELDRMKKSMAQYLDTHGGLRRVPSDPDTELFKRQVIDAFRHLGLDTNKFFGR